MAATAWSFYNSFREYIGNAAFDLDGTSTAFYMALHTSAASAAINTKRLRTVMVTQLGAHLLRLELGLLLRLTNIASTQPLLYGPLLVERLQILNMRLSIRLAVNWCVFLN